MRGTKSWILPRLTTDNLGRDRFDLRNVKRERPKLAAIDRQVDRVFAELRQPNLLNDHDEMGGHGAQTWGKMDRERRIKLRHHDVSVFVCEGQTDAMIAFLDLLETQPAGNGALRMRDRRLEPAESVEGPDDVQFAGVFRRRIAERENFQLHNTGRDAALKSLGARWPTASESHQGSACRGICHR